MQNYKLIFVKTSPSGYTLLLQVLRMRVYWEMKTKFIILRISAKYFYS